MNKRVGVLGGTFDPIHNAHLALAHAALQALALDEVLPCTARR
jgi:nicotinate-nucleotide adenylyltransferase